MNNDRNRNQENRSNEVGQRGNDNRGGNLGQDRIGSPNETRRENQSMAGGQQTSQPGSPSRKDSLDQDQRPGTRSNEGSREEGRGLGGSKGG